MAGEIWAFHQVYNDSFRVLEKSNGRIHLPNIPKTLCWRINICPLVPIPWDPCHKAYFTNTLGFFLCFQRRNRAKLYAQSLKSILIFIINIIEYSRIKNTPSQLESHISACRYIYTNVLVKTHDHVMLMRDISKFKQNDYEDFPELFYMDDWKVTFFKNPQIQ